MSLERECGRFTQPNVLTKLTSRGSGRKLRETESDKTKVKGSRIVWKVELIRQLGSNCLELFSLFHFSQKRLQRVWNHGGRPRLWSDFDRLHFHFSENIVIYLWLWFMSLQKSKYSWSTWMTLIGVRPNAFFAFCILNLGLTTIKGVLSYLNLKIGNIYLKICVGEKVLGNIYNVI